MKTYVVGLASNLDLRVRRDVERRRAVGVRAVRAGTVTAVVVSET